MFLVVTCLGRHTCTVPPPALIATLPGDDDPYSTITPSLSLSLSSSVSWTTSHSRVPCALLRPPLLSRDTLHLVVRPLGDRGYHTSPLMCFPDKKATVEKAVDSAKEKKKKAVEVTAAPKVSPIVILRSVAPLLSTLFTLYIMCCVMGGYTRS